MTVDLFAVQRHETYGNKPGVNLYRLRFITAEHVVLWTVLVLVMLQSKSILIYQTPYHFCSQIFKRGKMSLLGELHPPTATAYWGF